MRRENLEVKMNDDLRSALQSVKFIIFPFGGNEVYKTVADELKSVCPEALFWDSKKKNKYGLELIINDTNGKPNKSLPVKDSPAMYFQIDKFGNGRMEASHPNFLYALFSLIKEKYINDSIEKFENGISLTSVFPRLRNLSDFFVGSLRNSRNFNRNDYTRQLASLGFTYVTINGLGADRPFESGPHGDLYSWFYDYSPDLDQFVESKLLKGYYPPDYIQSNLNFLKNNAKLALKYGLTPGLHINSPRSMPEEFWKKYGFLRGARIDHPRESFRPRYTLAMSHPFVQEHYRELVTKIMREIPEIGFIHIWTNDSGSGFEFVSSLYAGRNGGPYLLREWKSDEEIAKKAAENILTYYNILSGEAKKINPDFRLICDLGPFYSERKYIIPKMGNGKDAGAFGNFLSIKIKGEEKQLRNTGALSYHNIDICDNNVLGLPYPFLVYERLKAASLKNKDWVLTGATPASLSSADINMEVLKAFQLSGEKNIQTFLSETAKSWAGEHSGRLLQIWGLIDSAVRSYPSGIPYGTFAFPWFRLWVRPFIPNIDAVPESERQYYEKFLLATFNNPARIDLNNDMMWNFLDVKEAGKKKKIIDRYVLPKFHDAVLIADRAVDNIPDGEKHLRLFSELRDRLLAGKCYYSTMRNLTAWIEAVHGYLKSDNKNEKSYFRSLAKEMAGNELENAKDLLLLWESSINFMPVNIKGETLHSYGENFGELLKNKIKLMENHMNDIPYINPEYMWRIPE